MMRGLAVTLLACAPTFGLADKAMTVCVQAQLAISGFSPGVIDGRIGPQTITAAQNLRGSATGLADLPELSVETSYDWCRSLGALDARLKGFWPARIESQTWLPEPIRETPGQDTLKIAVNTVAGYFAQTYERELVSEFVVLGAEAAVDLEREAERRRRNAGKDWAALFATSGMACPVQNELSVLGFRDMILLCWGETAQYDAAWITRYTNLMTTKLARHYVYALQSDLSGASRRALLPSGEDAAGPQWLRDGSAAMFEAEFSGGEPSTEALFNVVEGRSVALSELHLQVQTETEAAAARLAVHLLGARFRRDSIFTFFDRLRGAQSWDAAFQATFDMPLAAFEAEFETLCQDLPKAIRFSQGL